jgi:UTP--glucose-1-phosphate uridylyltransferase
MMQVKRVRKAVFPVAGMGTRFLPATKAMPKEMLPVVDKPLIQYAVEEAAAAGIDQMIFVTGRNKRAIEDHFDRAPEIEQLLERAGKHQLLEALMSATPRGVSFVYVRQPEPLGLGHAVLCAQPVVGDEPFAVILADDLIDATPGVTAQLVDSYMRHGASVLAVQDVPRSETSKYGIVASEPMDALEERVLRMVEKPKPEDAPSTLAVVGRYVLRPEIFDELATTPRGSGGEIQLTDAIARRVTAREVIVRRFAGVRFDCGSKSGFLEANLALGRRQGLIA